MFRAGTLVLKSLAAVRPFTLKGRSLIACKSNVGVWQILLGQNNYLQFFAGQKLYFRLLQDRLVISGYNNVESGGQARLFFYFLGHTGQIIYFQVFGGQNIYFQKLPVPPTSNQMVVPLVHIALNANMTCEATPN